MSRWLRLAMQTAFGLALLWLWLRTVSLPEIVTHARVHNWWAVAFMVVLFLFTSVVRARRWLLLLLGVVRVRRRHDEERQDIDDDDADDQRDPPRGQPTLCWRCGAVRDRFGRDLVARQDPSTVRVRDVAAAPCLAVPVRTAT